MGPGSTRTRSVLEVVVHQWPLTIFVPLILVLIVTLVLVTRSWDRRDELRAAERRAADGVAPRTGVVLPRPRAAEVPRRWGRRTPCDCSWHTTGVAVGVLSPPPVRRPVPSTRDAT